MRRHEPGPSSSVGVPHHTGRRPPAPRPHPLLHLQATVGNAAVAGMLQGTPTVQRQSVTNDAELRAAVGRQEWAPAVGYLATLSPEAVRKLVAPLGLGACESLLAKVKPDQHSVRGGLLECGFELTKGKEWAKAARFVSILDEPGIVRNVAPLSNPELRQLAKAARNEAGGGDERLLTAIRTKLKIDPGQLFGTVTTTPTPTDGVRGGGCNRSQPFFFKMDITFTPDPDIVDATQIGFVQTISMLRTGSDESVERRPGVKDRLNRENQAIDQSGTDDKGPHATNRWGWYGQRNDGSYKKGDTFGATPGAAVNGMVVPASMTDRPDGATPNVTYSFETSVIAQAGKDTGLTYAVVLWSFSADENLKVTYPKPKVVDKPSGAFAGAVAAWNTQATGPDRQPKDQEPLPVFRRMETDATPHAPPLSPRPPTAVPASVPPPAPGTGTVVVQRDPKNDDALKAIQGLPMFALLPKLAALSPEVRSDRDAGMGVGGPRLTAAMTAVDAKAKGTPWLDFVGSHSADLSSLPVDQIADVIGFLGAPKDARFYRKDQFDGRFDGAVDPVAGVIRLVVRVRFAFADGLRFGHSPAGTPAWEKETQEGKRQFGPDFKRVVESGWSGKGTVKPACAVGPVKQFRTEVQVEVVEKDEHILFDVLPGQGRDFVEKKGGRGALGTDANEPGAAEKRSVMDDTGKRPVDVSNVQVPSRHEFGHAIGVPHVRQTGGDNDANYGKTVTERQDVMGGGDKLQVIQRDGKVVHDDFVPFERIGERWGKDVFGALAPQCNKWTASAGS